MPHKLKSTARKSRRNRKIGIVVGVALLAIIIGAGAFYFFGQPSSPVTRYELLVKVEGSGSTNATETQTFNSGESVAVQAAASPDWVLNDWLINSTSAGSNNPLVVTMSNNLNLTAVFTQVPVQDTVLLQTSMGDITIQLRDDKPNTAGNFKKLVQEGKYDGTIFHRVIEGFMIQGGEINSSTASIPDEIGSNNSNVKGTIAMAKTSQPNSATSGFFINVVDNGDKVIDEAGTKFDAVYTVFGTVIKGMDVAEAISHVQVDDPTSQSPRPVQDVILIKAEILP